MGQLAGGPPIAELAGRAKAASRELALAGGAAKTELLHRAAELLASREAEILAANASDVARAEREGASATTVDRLRLSGARIEAMAAGLRAVAALPDPVGEVVDGWVRPNGLRVRRVRVPLGVIAVIYENRPNVTSRRRRPLPRLGERGRPARLGGGARLEPGDHARRIREALAKTGLPEDCVVLVEDTAHERRAQLMRLRGSSTASSPVAGRPSSR